MRLTPVRESDRAVERGQEVAARIGVKILEIHDLEGERSVSSLFDRVWGTVGQPVLPSNLLHAITHAGNYLVGAWADEELVGAAFGFLGSRRETPYLHSHMTGVDPKRQASGVGLALKLHQRGWALSHGLTRIEWTFDPLIRHNAYFNLMKLGATIVDYHVNFYGDMADQINAGDESDRVLVSWDLLSERVGTATEGRLPEIDLERVRSEGASVALDLHRDAPVTGPAGAPRLLCHIPDDVVGLRRSDPAAASVWRRALRETFGEALRSGYQATGMTRDGWYLLEKKA